MIEQRTTRIKQNLFLFGTLLGYWFILVALWWGSICLGWFTASSYGLLLLWWALVAIFGTLLAVILNRYPTRYLQLIIALLLFVQLAITFSVYGTTTRGFFVMILVLLIHMALYSFFLSKTNYFESRLHTTPWSISAVWIAGFGSVIGVMIGVMMGYQLLTADIDCESLINRVQSFVYSPVAPVSNLSATLVSRWEKPMSVLRGDENAQTYSWSVSSMSIYEVARAKVVDQILEDKEQVRQSICDIVADNIESKIQRGWGFIPTIVLLLIIVSPIVTIAFRALSIVIWILIKLLIALRVFQWEERVRQTKELR